MSTVKQRTILYDLQCEEGARMVDFHGWEMPVQFAGIGVEHQAVRGGCGRFDLGHMGRLRFRGTGALAFLERRVTRPLASAKPGQVRYGLVCAEDGTVEDDVLVSREGEESFHVVVNASNLDKLLALWQPQLPDDVHVENLSEQEAMIAVQGPEAATRLAAAGLEAGSCKYYRFVDRAWNGIRVRLSRTGYTGEDGFECFLPSERAADLWAALREVGVPPCGLGARDTLRLEAGMPLYGNELDRTRTPIEAGLDFAVGKDGGYIGAERILAQLADGPEQRLVGLRGSGRRPPRHGYPVLHNGGTVGTVTSGTLSPTLGVPIAMAYVPAALSAPGTRLGVDIRGKDVEAVEVVPLPFYKRER